MPEATLREEAAGGAAEGGDAGDTAAVGEVAGGPDRDRAALQTAREAGAAARFTEVGAEEDSVAGDFAEVLGDSGARIAVETRQQSLVETAAKETAEGKALKRREFVTRVIPSPRRGGRC